ncbi:hypothetical protein [Adhaeribacter terreus]|uniref:Uncharacterized protein n=1 Tax=Adhaeribacter terreus TaxID=529703 RepID=A0ABW0E779_9BACT
MQILYAVTFRAKNNPGSGLLQKIKLVAGDQVQAVEFASQQAEALNLEVIRVEELQPVEQGAFPLFTNLQFQDDLRQ